MKHNKVIITGASDGLGKELAKICINGGIEVVCLSRSKPDYECIHIKTDLADDKSVLNTVNEIKSKHSKFDALINCAGLISISSPQEINYEEIERLFKVNTIAPMFLASHLLSLIKDNEADILNVGSTAGTKGKGSELVYGSSKWGLNGVSKSLQDELAKTKCRVTQFNPGGMQTKLFDKFENGRVDTSKFMSPQHVAQLMFYILNLPKEMEVSEILINRK